MFNDESLVSSHNTLRYYRASIIFKSGNAVREAFVAVVRWRKRSIKIDAHQKLQMKIRSMFNWEQNPVQIKFGGFFNHDVNNARKRTQCGLL